MFKPSEIAKFSRIFDDSSLKKVYQMSLQLTARVSRKWADLDSVREQRKLEARKMLENEAGREAAVPSVQCTME